MASEVITVTGLEWVRGTEEPLDCYGWLEVHDWEDSALADRDAFGLNLRLLGMSETSVSEALAIRDVGAGEVAKAAEKLEPYKNISFFRSPPELIEAQQLYRSARDSTRQQLYDFYQERVTTIESSEPLEVKIPLFVLGAPIAPDCKAEWMNTTEFEYGSGWSLKVAGSGLGSDLSATFIKSASFEASSGETKLIYCPVMVHLEYVKITEPGQPTTWRWRLDLSGITESKLTPGLMLLKPESVPARGEHVHRFPLADDPSGSLATYTHEYSQQTATTINVGINVHDIQLGLSANSTISSSIAVKYTLKSGLDYDLFQAQEADGLLFGPTGI